MRASGFIVSGVCAVVLVFGSAASAEIDINVDGVDGMFNRLPVEVGRQAATGGAQHRDVQRAGALNDRRHRRVSIRVPRPLSGVDRDGVGVEGHREDPARVGGLDVVANNEPIDRPARRLGIHAKHRRGLLGENRHTDQHAQQQRNADSAWHGSS